MGENPQRRSLSSFQSLLYGDLEPDVWYSICDLPGYRRFPDWFYRQQSEPRATLRPMVEKGAVEMKRVELGIPVFRKIDQSNPGSPA